MDENMFNFYDIWLVVEFHDDSAIGFDGPAGKKQRFKKNRKYLAKTYNHRAEDPYILFPFEKVESMISYRGEFSQTRVSSISWLVKSMIRYDFFKNSVISDAEEY